MMEARRRQRFSKNGPSTVFPGILPFFFYQLIEIVIRLKGLLYNLSYFSQVFYRFCLITDTDFSLVNGIFQEVNSLVVNLDRDRKWMSVFSTMSKRKTGRVGKAGRCTVNYFAYKGKGL